MEIRNGGGGLVSLRFRDQSERKRKGVLCFFRTSSGSGVEEMNDGMVCKREPSRRTGRADQPVKGGLFFNKKNKTRIYKQ